MAVAKSSVIGARLDLAFIAKVQLNYLALSGAERAEMGQCLQELQG
jgi:hypothetical protein